MMDMQHSVVQPLTVGNTCSFPRNQGGMLPEGQITVQHLKKDSHGWKWDNPLEMPRENTSTVQIPRHNFLSFPSIAISHV